tara:strand:- start:521 stop:871 length:351 start_codon:yes stop_codon:yes gene_type:complete
MAVVQSQSINIVIDQGADFSKNLTVTTDGSTAYDISGLTFTGQIRPSYESSTLTATFTASIVTAASGIYKITLTDTVTKNISAGRYVYDVMMTLTDSTIEVVQKGIITVNPRVTQL